MTNEFTQNNKIYKYLKKKAKYTDFLEQLYGVCEKRLLLVAQTFPNYTLHDIGHVSRVAGYMADIVYPKMRKCSDLHLVMILCAGLLHDTGMIVHLTEKDEYIKENNCSEQDFQDYVRKNHAARVAEVLKRPEIRNLFKVNFAGYEDIILDDLEKICKAHTEDSDWALKNISDTSRNLGYDEYNPQQIAFLLRLGDALDFDNRRAPEYMIDALKITGFSEEEWKKHVLITNYNKVKHKDDKIEISFEGICKNNKYFKAAIKSVEWITGAAKEISSITSKYEEPYCFTLLPVVNNVKGDNFYCSKLHFELDYNKVLNLLMGEHIYSSEKDGLRELIQNAIDAVMVKNEEQILKKRRYSPLITIEMNKDENNLSIQDNGMGMTKEIIEKYFFKIGKSYYASEEFKSRNGRYNPIGRFGIGFMACFMLSDVVTVETKAANGENWIYELEKDYDFVIYKQNQGTNIDSHGTRVTLRYDKVIGPIFKDETEVICYVKDLVLTDDFELEILDSAGERHSVANKLEAKNDIRLIEGDDMDIAYRMTKTPLIYSEIQELSSMRRNKFVYLWGYDSALFPDGYYVDIDDLFKGIYDFEQSSEELLTKENLINFYKDKKNSRLYTDFQLIFKYANVQDGEEFDDVFLNDVLLELALNTKVGKMISIPYLADAESKTVFDRAVNKGQNAYQKKHEPNYKYFNFEFVDIIVAKNAELRLTDVTIIDIVNEVIEKHDGIKNRAYYEQIKSTDVYPFELVKGPAASKKTEDGYVVLEEDYDIHSWITASKVYMNGILVKEDNLVFPSVIEGTEFDYLEINVKSREYGLNVARSQFEKESRDNIAREAIIRIYEDFLESEEYEDYDEGKKPIEFYIEMMKPENVAYSS